VDRHKWSAAHPGRFSSKKEWSLPFEYDSGWATVLTYVCYYSDIIIIIIIIILPTSTFRDCDETEQVTSLNLRQDLLCLTTK